MCFFVAFVPFMLQMIWGVLFLDLCIGYGLSIRIHVYKFHASIRNWRVNISKYILPANICNYNRRCISGFICVRFTRDLEADRWEWPDPFCNQTASICFPYNHPPTQVVSKNTTSHPSGIKVQPPAPKWYQKIPSEMDPALHYKLLDCLQCLDSFSPTCTKMLSTDIASPPKHHFFCTKNFTHNIVKIVDLIAFEFWSKQDAGNILKGYISVLSPS